MKTKEEFTGHCDTPDGFFIPCSDKKCKWYKENENKNREKAKYEYIEQTEGEGFLVLLEE